MRCFWEFWGQMGSYTSRNKTQNHAQSWPPENIACAVQHHLVLGVTASTVAGSHLAPLLKKPNTSATAQGRRQSFNIALHWVSLTRVCLVEPSPMPTSYLHAWLGIWVPTSWTYNMGFSHVRERFYKIWAVKNVTGIHYRIHIILFFKILFSRDCG